MAWARRGTQAGFPVSHRSLETWPLPRFRLGWRVAYRIEDVFAQAQQRIDASAYGYSDAEDAGGPLAACS